MFKRFSALGLAALQLFACSQSVVDSANPGGEEAHGSPEDYAVSSSELSSIDCSSRTDTGYTAGAPFAIEVVSVDGKPVERQTANAYYVMAQAAARAGVVLKVVSGFRTLAEQQYLYSCYVNCSCNNCNLAAQPGYSNHQSGHALDLNSEAPGVLSWLNANGSAYGFRRTVSGEPWHWEWWSGGPGGGPCGNTSNGGSQTSAYDPIEVYWARQADGSYALRALAGSAVTKVDYFVDGYAIGSATRDDGSNFPASYAFSLEKQERLFEVRGYDEADTQIAKGVGLMDVTSGVGVYIKQMGSALYEVGLERAPTGVAAIEVRADGYLLKDAVSGATHSTRAAVRSKFLTLGERAFVIQTFNADGSVRGTLRRSFRLE
ncbi:MAG: M15 family metallopeptidase [Polyangiaceae bacterium]